MYTSLKIVKKLVYAWMYYPNGLSTGFTISKGYITGDEFTGLLQIVEQGKTKRPEVNILNVTIQDEYSGGSEMSFSNFADLQQQLVYLDNPLVQQPGGGISEGGSGAVYNNDFTYNGGSQEFEITIPNIIVKNVFRGRVRLFKNEYSYVGNKVTIFYDVLEIGEVISITN
jgi:hypothetical protein